MPVYRLPSNKHLLFSNQTYRFQSERRLSDRYLLFRRSSGQKGNLQQTRQTTTVCYFIWRQNLNLKASKTSTVEPKKLLTEEPKRGNNNKPTAEVRKKILFSPVTFSKINELRKCDQKKKHWCFFRVAYFWTTWPTLFNCRFKHSQALNEAAELSVYRKSLWAFFFFSNKFTTWN